LASG
jgi:hypothetical protein